VLFRSNLKIFTFLKLKLIFREMILLDPKGKYSGDALALAVKNAQVSCPLDCEKLLKISMKSN